MNQSHNFFKRYLSFSSQMTISFLLKTSYHHLPFGGGVAIFVHLWEFGKLHSKEFFSSRLQKPQHTSFIQSLGRRRCPFIFQAKNCKKKRHTQKVFTRRIFMCGISFWNVAAAVLCVPSTSSIAVEYTASR